MKFETILYIILAICVALFFIAVTTKSVMDSHSEQLVCELHQGLYSWDSGSCFIKQDDGTFKKYIIDNVNGTYVLIK